MKIEIDLPVIEGYEYTGEYRLPKEGEWYLYCCENMALKAALSFKENERHILKKIEAPNLDDMLDKWTENVSDTSYFEEINRQLKALQDKQ